MIAVISDSHIGRKSDDIPEEFLEIVEEADLAVHCGDFETEEVYDMLVEKAEDFVAVMGNCDRFELDDYEKFDYKGESFGVTHGKGIHPRGHKPTLVNIAEQLGVRILLHGHTHRQEAVEHEDKILLNPGSCTGAPGGSYGGGAPEMMTLEVEDGKLEVELLSLQEGVEKEQKVFNI